MIVLFIANPNTETPRGVTPLISMVLNNAPAEHIEELVRRGVNLTYSNEQGMTALMYACRNKEDKLLHILIRNGCLITAAGKGIGSGAAGNGITALHLCAIHGYEEGATILLDYVKENGSRYTIHDELYYTHH